MTHPFVPALLAERAGYVRQGRVERAAAVDEQLRAHGYDTSDLPPAALEQPSRTTPPKGRRRPPKEQA